MIQNQAGQSIGAQMILASSGAAFAGAVTIYITIDAGVQAIGSVSGGACVHEGNGYHSYLPSADETNGALIAFTFIGTGAVPQTVQIWTVLPASESAIPAAPNPLAISALQLVTDALQEIGVLGAADVASGDDADFSLRKLNRLLDNWNADRSAVYTDVLSSFSLTPSLQPHTIGPSGATFSATQRPLMIDGVNLVVNGIRYPLTARDAAWRMALSTPTLAGAIPTDFFYQPAWPNGNLYLYPVPTAASDLELLTCVLLGPLALTDVFWMPSGYQDAVTLTLAEALAGPFRVKMADFPELSRAAMQARAKVFSRNEITPSIRTQDAGMPGGGGSFDYRSGLVR